jgi:hypothetical protein
MNKYIRNEITKLKFKKRLSLHIQKTKIDPNEYKFYAFKSHSTVCSCFLCRDVKYSRTSKYKAEEW